MELFIKRFIDILDETVPVTLVHTLIEQPLGAVIHDHYIKIHGRLDLANDESPYVEIEIYPYESRYIHALFGITYPKAGIINETEFIEKIKQEHEIQVEKVISIAEEDNFYYRVYYEEQINVPENNGEKDQLLKKLISKIKERLLISGYEVGNEE
ncbi:hypothetical protein BHF71_04735 [Vulcanibacillus modesticaldus]|uniref:Uncharacterized protein n=1 Tax=Vulcanibacillus modesticaldus TaxID=337097 RepID=A0A1D2YRS0_9BACI|nr:hypothetical protein [Vulcanibacillus modesticaldus]OEF95502.1 hypothetical protein BHF71_04735 [Vulcanibacillus modesticaldus]